MKKYVSPVLPLILALAAAVFPQSGIINVFETVRIKDGKRAEALFYYENNWKVLREKALAGGLIHSYEMIETEPDDTADFDIILITRYADRRQFERSEENFRKLIGQGGGRKLLNGLKPEEFRENVFVKTGRVPFAAQKKTNLPADECGPNELRAFDFLLGNWRQKNGSGTMKISRILEGCGIQENWQLEEFSAVLMRSYDKASEKWYLTFVAHDLVPQVWEGRIENGRWVFYRDWELNGKRRRSRTFWKITADGVFEKIVEQLNDDRQTWRLHDRAVFEKEDRPAEQKGFLSN